MTLWKEQWFLGSSSEWFNNRSAAEVPSTSNEEGLSATYEWSARNLRHISSSATDRSSPALVESISHSPMSNKRKICLHSTRFPFSCSSHIVFPFHSLKGISVTGMLYERSLLANGVQQKKYAKVLQYDLVPVCNCWKPYVWKIEISGFPDF